MKITSKVLGAAAVLLMWLVITVASAQAWPWSEKWVLILPPSIMVNHKPTDLLDLDAPLSEWFILDHYISQQECLDGQRFNEELTVKTEHRLAQKNAEAPGRHSTIWALDGARSHLQAIRASKCVTITEMRASKRDAR